MANTLYSDLTKTQYPAQIDSRYPVAAVTDLRFPSADNANLVYTIGEQHENTDMNPETDYTTYIMAAHINVLQEAMLCVERTLGIMPQGDFKTVKARIENLEDKDYDIRYITANSVGWTYDSARDTLYAHKHLGGTASPSKVDLASEVQGLLPKTAIELGVTNSSLMATDIKMSSTDNRTIKDSIDAQFPRTAGTSYPITGDLYLDNKFFGGLYGEWDAQDHIEGISSTKVSDDKAYSGYSVKSGTTNEFMIIGPTGGYQKLRYGKFVVGFRIKITDPPDAEAMVCQLSVGNVLEQNVRNIYAKDFENPGNYEMLYITFDHTPTSDNLNRFYFGVWRHNAAVGYLYIDSIIIMPSHTSVYDD